jgi:hypothetical protein
MKALRCNRIINFRNGSDFEHPPVTENEHGCASTVGQASIGVARG